MRCTPLVFATLTCLGCRTTSPATSIASPQDVPVSEQPVLRPFARAGFFMLVEPLVVRAGADSLVVPAGFVTDFASIPRSAQSFVPKLGPHLCPAIVHDYLYWGQMCTREEADAVFLEMMERLGVPRATRQIMYSAVKRFGEPAWKGNERDRAAGLTRIIPPGAEAIGPFETWKSYREHLRSENQPSEPSPVITPGFCSYPKLVKAEGARRN